MTSKSKSYCSVPQCNNYISENISMHRFPRDANLIKKWQTAMKIGKPITKCMMVCSEHFLPSDYSSSTPNPQRKFLKKSAVPSQKVPITTHQLPEKTRMSRKKLIIEDPPLEEMDINVDEELEMMADNPEVNMPSSSGTGTKYGSYGEFTDPLTHVECTTYADKACQTDPELWNQFDLTSVLDTDAKLHCFTGLDRNMLKNIETCCNTVGSYNKYNLLGMQMKLLIVFIKLRLNISFLCLAVLFNLSASTCASYFYNTVELLATTLKPVIYWPTVGEIRANLPKCFEKFQTTRVVLDCTEVSVQRCNCLKCRIKTYSHYKSTHTIKWLIGITPSGLISYVSAGYGGRTSDKSIVKKENFLAKCDPGDAVMVDKGFMIEKECEEILVKLIRPPFLKKNTQLTKAEAEKTADIARARVHVERAIQRLKIFRIVKDKIDWYLLPYMDSIMNIIAAVVNLSPPILAEDKFE